jgi:uncharacterized protein YecT (DUF1311 family)
MKIFVALLVGLAALSSSAEEQKEPTLAEAKAAFAKADRALNDAWAAAKKALPENVVAELTIRQRAWVQFRDQRAQWEASGPDEAAAKRSPSYFSMAADLTESRVKWLRGRTTGWGDTLTGSWIDSYGGTVEIVAEENRLLFVFSVVRGHTLDLGSLAGVAAWNERIGWFSDKGRDKAKDDEASLAFIRRDGEIEVIGANTTYYHGVHAYFDGVYCKVASLDEKRKAAVTQAAESGQVPED